MYDIATQMKERWRPHLYRNLKTFNSLAKLNFNIENVLDRAERFTHPGVLTNQFIWSGATLISHERPPAYLPTLDKQFKQFLSKYSPNTLEKQKLLRMFLDNFADFAFLMAFCSFCFKRKIKVLEIEPKNPLIQNRQLDVKIQIEDRPIFVEIVSPLESFAKGKDLTSHIQYKIKHHKLGQLHSPTIILLNVTDTSWGNNPFNGGLINDRMFYPISRTFRYPNSNIPSEISALLIRFGEELRCHSSITATKPLSRQELNKLSKPFLSQRILRLLK